MPTDATLGAGLPTPLPSGVRLRATTRDDVAAIVDLLADDPLGATREASGELAPYVAAFDRVDADPSELLVVVDDGALVVATMQLSLLAGLARRGALRLQIEAVRVAASHRSAGTGEGMMRWAVGEAERLGCRVVQLTSDRSRPDAHRFYERLGFVATHVGYKLTIPAPSG